MQKQHVRKKTIQKHATSSASAGGRAFRCQGICIAGAPSPHHAQLLLPLLLHRRGRPSEVLAAVVEAACAVAARGNARRSRPSAARGLADGEVGLVLWSRPPPHNPGCVVYGSAVADEHLRGYAASFSPIQTAALNLCYLRARPSGCGRGYGLGRGSSSSTDGGRSRGVGGGAQRGWGRGRAGTLSLSAEARAEAASKQEEVEACFPRARPVLLPARRKMRLVGGHGWNSR
jgi:hypothetical protein